MTGARWEDYFLPGEKLLWQGAPVPGFHAWPMAVFMTLFGIPFLAAGGGLSLGGLFFAFQAKSATDLGGTLLAAVFGLPFLAVGLFLVVGQWIIAAQAPRRVRYALSTRAAYIAKHYWGRDLAIYPILRSSGLELKTGRRAASVWFYSQRETDSDGDERTQRAGFENIADGEKVLRLIRELQLQSAPSSSASFREAPDDPVS
ncbi:hypothetical protein [Paenirhodobacter sp. CAU 1674]|uniref:hypothetical protein n=1 Tax=Paenirhodobacter sp. CAU 1674 TaxID=3032596 RepID=UPI0023DB81A5|nr:hypothetical protein [Paenirhodobacter sp. CAU 1674]MDF2141000.1 hypothetical protein [Paenirhodobacter sp. CAU 1674]